MPPLNSEHIAGGDRLGASSLLEANRIAPNAEPHVRMCAEWVYVYMTRVTNRICELLMLACRKGNCAVHCLDLQAV